MDDEIHSVIYFLWLRGASKEKIVSQIQETYGDGMIYVQSAQRWTHDFAAARTELDALPRPGRPIDSENAGGIRELLQSEAYISKKTLSRKLDLHHGTVHRIFTKERGLSKVNFKLIPHSLTDSHT
jgi:DNA invertase Pin-like site-specific DNA recombinase